MTSLFEIGPADVAMTNDEWYTPRWIFKAAGLTFDLDVCAPVAPEFRTCPARRYLTIINDGLTAPWEGIVWCNPPYSNPRPWADRLLGHPEWMALVPASCNTWRGALTAAADAVALMSIGARNGTAWAGFGRPDGSQTGWPFALTLLGRGRACVEAVGRAAAADPYACGAYHVRPGRLGPGSHTHWTARPSRGYDSTHRVAIRVYGLGKVKAIPSVSYARKLSGLTRGPALTDSEAVVFLRNRSRSRPLRSNLAQTARSLRHDNHLRTRHHR